MKITVSKSELQSRLKLVGRIIQPQKTNPILEDFLFEVDTSSDILTVTGSDDAGRITTTVDCQIDNGDLAGFTVHAKTLLEAISEIPEQPLIFTIKQKKERIDITCQYSTGKFDLAGQTPELYIKYAEMPADVDTTSIDASDLLEGLRRTINRCASDELRPVMNGVYFDQNAEGVNYVATNGNSLTVAAFYPKGGTRLAFIIPGRIAKILVQTLVATTETLIVSVSSSYMKIDCELFSLQARLIEGRYPNYNAVIPKSNDKAAIVNRLILISALKRVSVLGNKSSNLIKLSFAKNNLTISAQDIDYSTAASEDLPINYESESIEIGFNSLKLLDILQDLITTEVEVSMSDPSRAGLIKEVGNSSNRDVTMLLMPLTIN